MGLTNAILVNILEIQIVTNLLYYTEIEWLSTHKVLNVNFELCYMKLSEIMKMLRSPMSKVLGIFSWYYKPP